MSTRSSKRIRKPKFRRCLGQNHHAHPHTHIQSRLRTARNDGVPLGENQLMSIEIVFHVLSPLPGIERDDIDGIQMQLSNIVESMNRDYSMRCDNFNNANTNLPLFQHCRVVASASSDPKSDQRSASAAAYKISRLTTGRAAALTATTTSSKAGAAASAATIDLVELYNDYLGRAGDTRIRFTNDPAKNIILCNSSGASSSHHHSTNFSKAIASFDPDDPDVSNKLNKVIKYSEAGGSDRVPNKLNIWTAQLPGTLLGYSSFPWEYADAPNVDGVVINSQVAGIEFKCSQSIDYRPYNRLKTFTHETAHWLGLFHTFEDHIYCDPLTHANGGAQQDDYVQDTPHQLQPTDGNPYEEKHWPVDDNGTHHMFMNHMDYTNDVAMFLFTHGQAERMQLTLQAFRPKYFEILTDQSHNKLNIKSTTKGLSRGLTKGLTKNTRTRKPSKSIARHNKNRTSDPSLHISAERKTQLRNPDNNNTTIIEDDKKSIGNSPTPATNTSVPATVEAPPPSYWKRFTSYLSSVHCC